MSFIFDMLLHLFNSFTILVYFTGVMEVKSGNRLINRAGIAFSFLAAALLSHIFRYIPPMRFVSVVSLTAFTAFAFFSGGIWHKLRTVAESIMLSMVGELFGLIVCGIVSNRGFNTMEYDSPDRGVMSLVLSAFIAGVVPVAILLRKKKHGHELWRVVMCQAIIAFTQISMIMLAYFYSENPTKELVYAIALIQIPGLLLSLFCTRLILTISKLVINKREQEFEQAKNDMEYDYYKLALESNTRLSILRHDIGNTLQTAMTLIHNGEIQKGNKLLGEIDRVSKSTAPVVVSDNDIINVILTLKYEELKKSGITLKINVKCELFDFPASDRELTSVLTNLMDNAKEACLGCDGEKTVEITFGKQQGFYIIKMENTVGGQNIYIPESVADAVTTKTDKELHGFGLRSIFEICKSYNGNFSMYQENGRVISIVTFAQKETQEE